MDRDLDLSSSSHMPSSIADVDLSPTADHKSGRPGVGSTAAVTKKRGRRK
jgi:hypothetical protein